MELYKMKSLDTQLESNNVQIMNLDFKDEQQKVPKKNVRKDGREVVREGLQLAKKKAKLDVLDEEDSFSREARGEDSPLFIEDSIQSNQLDQNDDNPVPSDHNQNQQRVLSDPSAKQTQGSYKYGAQKDLQVTVKYLEPGVEYDPLKPDEEITAAVNRVIDETI